MRRDRSFPSPPSSVGIPSAEEARQERRASSDRFIEAAHQGPEIRRVSSTMRGLRIRNGFEDLIEDAMEQRRRPR